MERVDILHKVFYSLHVCLWGVEECEHMEHWGGGNIIFLTNFFLNLEGYLCSRYQHIKIREVMGTWSQNRGFWYYL